MSIEARDWARSVLRTLAAKDATPATRLVLFYLGDRADPRGSCVLYRAALVDELGLGENTVERSLAQLRKLGLLASEQRRAAGSRELLANRWQLLMRPHSGGEGHPHSGGEVTPGMGAVDRIPTENTEREGGVRRLDDQEDTMSQDPEGMVGMFDVEPVKTKTRTRKAADTSKRTPAQRIASAWYDARKAATGLPPGEFPKVLKHATDLLKAEIPEDLLLEAAETMGRDARHTNLRGAYDDLVAQRRRPEAITTNADGSSFQGAKAWVGGLEPSGPAWSDTEWGRSARQFRAPEPVAPPAWSSRPA